MRLSTRPRLEETVGGFAKEAGHAGLFGPTRLPQQRQRQRRRQIKRTAAARGTETQSRECIALNRTRRVWCPALWRRRTPSRPRVGNGGEAEEVGAARRRRSTTRRGSECAVPQACSQAQDRPRSRQREHAEARLHSLLFLCSPYTLQMAGAKPELSKKLPTVQPPLALLLCKLCKLSFGK